MSLYLVRHGYAARRDGRSFGPWAAGETVEVDQADAEWIDRDSPGALVEAAPAVEADQAADVERQAEPMPNRQHKGGRNRAGAA